MTENQFFIGLINMNITAAYVIIFVLVLRLFLKRLPKIYSYVLWSVVGLRLILPVSVTWVFSLFSLPFFKGLNNGGHMEFIPKNIGYMNIPTVNTGISSINSSINNLLPPSNPSGSVNPLQIYLYAGFYIWILGILFILTYALFAYIRTKRLIRQAVIYRDNIYECDNIPTPFIMGIIKPKIYIPFRLEERELSYILCHENHHIRRLDHVVKIISFLLCAFHWFNPLVWVAYFCMNSDMEKSCDEWVISHMKGNIKEDYSAYLLSFASNRRHLPFGPLAFGETSVKRRIKNILRFKKPSVFLSVLGIIAVTVFACVCVTNGKGEGQAYEDVSRWAQSFVDRDAKAVIKMSSEECTHELTEEGFLDSYENPSLGWSSPWPWGTEQYKIASLEPEKGSAEIIYYALVSDPHISIWKQSISFEGRGEDFIVTGENTSFLDSISDAEAFFEAYPKGIIEGTFMDYSQNGLGEDLNRNAESDNIYAFLFDDPARACMYILGIDENFCKSKVLESESDTECKVEIDFLEAPTQSIEIEMKKPFGKDGIWVPGNAVANGMSAPSFIERDAGYESDLAYERSLELSDENGDHVGFYVRNEGDSDIIISVNDNTQSSIYPGEEGFVSTEVKDSGKTYTLRAYSPEPGSIININFSIIQYYSA